MLVSGRGNAFLRKATVKMLVEIGSDPQVAILGNLGLRTAGGLNANTSTNTSSTGEYDTDVELAQIKPLLTRLTSALNLKSRSNKPLEPEMLVKLGFLRKTVLPQPYIKVAQYGDAQMMKIEAYSTSREEALTMSNLLAEYYMESRVERTKQEFKQARMLVEGRMQEVADNYRGGLSRAADFKEQTGVADIDKELSAVINKVYTLQTSNEENEKNIVEADRKLALAREKLKEIKPFRKDSQEYIQSDLIKYVQQKFGDLTMSLAEKSVDITKEHPDYQVLEKKIEAVKELVRSELDAGQKLVLNSERLSIDPEYDDLYKKTYTDYIDREAAIAKRVVLQEYIDDYKKVLLGFAAKASTLNELDADTAVYKTTYSNLLGLMAQLSVAEAIAMTNINIVEHATIPDKQYFPSVLLNSIAAIILGVLFALGAAFFVDYADTSVSTPEDFKRLNLVTRLGSIPFSRHLKKKRIVSTLPPAAREREAFRAVRNSIDYELAGRALSSLAVTSSFAREGKSTVAANLAVLCSDRQKKVLLVDLNLLNPTLHTAFNVDNSTGVSDVLAGGVELKSAIRSSATPGLDVLPCGKVPADAGRVAEADRVREILNDLKGMYDLVIIETPAILSFSNAVLIARLADGVVHVVEYGRVKSAMFEHVQQLMSKAGISCVGAVVNKEDAVTF
ncbi:MAG: polysaccharide biosynthesis tyrosine autokinase [Chitinivibrionia bacterium]|nr:polysaccharide biosynthesis tyrosine autokinase [Chitinivibrionia bacterium]